MTASDVTFTRTVDLSGSTFTGDVDFRGASFEAPALFRAAPTETATGERATRAARFRGTADFSLAFFDQYASFAGAVFEREAAFRDTRFSDATFAAASFANAAFDRASFRGAALFNKAEFLRPAVFSESDFRARADFSLATFVAGADFARAQFGSTASFLAARFTSSPASRRAATFQNAAASADLNFTFGRFERGADAPTDTVVAVFSDLVVGRSLVLRDVTFAEGQRVSMAQLQVSDLVLDVAAAPQISGEDNRKSVLGEIEQSAKARGDLAVANDAHYALRQLQSEEYGPLRRAFDVVVYRGAAGYFVNPTHPLVLLLVLGLVAALVRAGRRAEQVEPAGANPGSRWGDWLGRIRLPRLVARAGAAAGRLFRAMWLPLRAFLVGLLDTFALLVPGRKTDGTPPFHIRLEAVTYRLLFVFALLGLANSNPALREMVDTLF